MEPTQARHLRHPMTLHLEAIRRQETMRIPPLALAMTPIPWIVLAIVLVLLGVL